MQGQEFGFTPDLFDAANRHLAGLRPQPGLIQDLPEIPPVFGKPGASDRQLQSVERHLGHALPPDLRWLVTNTFDPSGYLFRWVGDPTAIDRFRDWVRDGIEADVRAGLWLTQWGAPPDDPEARAERFRKEFESWPRLIPLIGHRALVVEPIEAGNPVFSIMQSDIIQYGHDLASWIEIEFTHQSRWEEQRFDRSIPFWSRFNNPGSDFYWG